MVSPDPVVEPLIFIPKVKLPSLLITIAAFEEVNACTDGEP